MKHAQMSLFEATYEPFRIDRPIRLIELFGGIGAQAKALEILGIPFENHRYIEWSWQSIVAYAAIHHGDDRTDYSEGMDRESLVNAIDGVSSDYQTPVSRETLMRKPEEWLRKVYNAMRASHNPCPNISNVKAKDLGIVDRDRYVYLMTYSFPCQDLSNAGKMAGMAKGSGTRSGLLWEVERILLELGEADSLPQILLMENVPGVCGAGNAEPFNAWLDALEAMGYVNYHRIINAKDYGIPQNRKRCFMVSILGEWAYTFPDGMRLEHNLASFLDKGEIDERYYLSDEQVRSFEAHNEKEAERDNNFAFRPIDPNGGGACPTQSPQRKEADQPPLSSMTTDDSGGGNVQMRLAASQPTSSSGGTTSNVIGYWDGPRWKQCRAVYDKGGCSPTLCAKMGGGDGYPYVTNAKKGLKVNRKHLEQGLSRFDPSKGVSAAKLNLSDSFGSPLSEGVSPTLGTNNGSSVFAFIPEGKDDE